MGKFIAIETACPCGGKLSGEILRPSRIAPRVLKLNCADCESRYLISCKLGTEGSVDFTVKSVELSARAKHVIGVDLGVMTPE